MICWILTDLSGRMRDAINHRVSPAPVIACQGSTSSVGLATGRLNLGCSCVLTDSSAWTRLTAGKPSTGGSKRTVYSLTSLPEGHITSITKFRKGSTIGLRLLTIMTVLPLDLNNTSKLRSYKSERRSTFNCSKSS